MHKRWRLIKNFDEGLIPPFSALPPLVAKLLYNRNITSEEEAEKFLNPKYEEGLHSPFLFLHMQKAVERIWQAIENKEKICVYGDYDADAVTACAVLLHTFRELGANAQYYIPDRFSEGYGVNLEALQKIQNDAVSLVITVDCGTNSLDAAEFCKQNNIDLIVTDHHEIVGKIPEVFALINPKNPLDTYPYHEITGVGVAFKLACAIFKNPKSGMVNTKFKSGWEKWLLDLVAIGTVADCHSLTGENRILVKFGLKVLAKSKWQGLLAICNSAGLDFSKKAPDTYILGYVLAPRLNAAGRLKHASIALEALLETDPVLAKVKASELEKINSHRQQITENLMSEAREQAELVRDRKIIVLKNSGWSKGLVGLLAGKIAEEFCRPTIVLSVAEGIATGSARTVGDFDLVKALKFSAQYLERFGGHKQAAGLSLKEENFENFYQKLLDYEAQEEQKVVFEKVLELEAELFEEDWSFETYQNLVLFEPFGAGNLPPKFLLKEVKITNMRLVGKSQNHLQISFQKNQKQVDGIAFNQGHFAKLYQIGDLVHMAGEMICEEFAGRKKVKLRVLDIKNTLEQI